MKPDWSFFYTTLGGSIFNSGSRMLDLILRILIGLLFEMGLVYSTSVDFGYSCLVILFARDPCSLNCLVDSNAFSVCWLENGPVATCIGMVVLCTGVWLPLRIGLMDCTFEIVYFLLNAVFFRDYLTRFSSWAICSTYNSICQLLIGSCSLFSSISLSWL